MRDRIVCWRLRRLFLAAGGLRWPAQVSDSGTGLRYGLPDKAAMNYVSRCLGQAPPRPVQLYARGGWYVTEDLRQQLLERQGNMEGIAMVWKLKDLPARRVSVEPRRRVQSRRRCLSRFQRQSHPI